MMEIYNNEISFVLKSRASNVKAFETTFFSLKSAISNIFKMKKLPTESPGKAFLN